MGLLKSAGLAAVTGGASLALTNKGLLFGKKDPGTRDQFLGLDPTLRAVTDESRQAQAEVARLFKEQLKGLKGAPSADELARRTAFKQERGLRAAAADTGRKAQEVIAQRGLGKSALGVRAATAPTQQLGEKIGQVRADLPFLQQQFQQQRTGQLRGIAGGLGQLLGAPGAQRGFIQGRKGGGRGGGLLSIGLGAAGAFAAGKKGGNPAAGFQAGQGAGRGIANL